MMKNESVVERAEPPEGAKEMRWRYFQRRVMDGSGRVRLREGVRHAGKARLARRQDLQGALYCVDVSGWSLQGSARREHGRRGVVVCC